MVSELSGKEIIFKVKQSWFLKNFHPKTKLHNRSKANMTVDVSIFKEILIPSSAFINMFHLC